MTYKKLTGKDRVRTSDTVLIDADRAGASETASFPDCARKSVSWEHGERRPTQYPLPFPAVREAGKGAVRDSEEAIQEETAEVRGKRTKQKSSFAATLELSLQVCQNNCTRKMGSTCLNISDHRSNHIGGYIEDPHRLIVGKYHFRMHNWVAVNCPDSISDRPLLSLSWCSTGFGKVLHFVFNAAAKSYNRIFLPSTVPSVVACLSKTCS